MILSLNQYLEALGIQLKHYRRVKGFTQRQLSDISGIAVRQVQRIEKGDSNVTLQTLYAMAGALGVTVAELLPGENLSHHWELTKSEEKVISNMVGHDFYPAQTLLEDFTQAALAEQLFCAQELIKNREILDDNRFLTLVVEDGYSYFPSSTQKKLQSGDKVLIGSNMKNPEAAPQLYNRVLSTHETVKLDLKMQTPDIKRVSGFIKCCNPDSSKKIILGIMIDISFLGPKER